MKFKEVTLGGNIQHKANGRTPEQIQQDWEQGKSRCGYCCNQDNATWEVICDCFLFTIWDQQTIEIASFGKD